jgi:hypothetical protein
MSGSFSLIKNNNKFIRDYPAFDDNLETVTTQNVDAFDLNTQYYEDLPR